MAIKDLTGLALGILLFVIVCLALDAITTNNPLRREEDIREIGTVSNAAIGIWRLV